MVELIAVYPDRAEFAGSGWVFPKLLNSCPPGFDASGGVLRSLLMSNVYFRKNLCSGICIQMWRFCRKFETLKRPMTLNKPTLRLTLAALAVPVLAVVASSQESSSTTPVLPATPAIQWMGRHPRVGGCRLWRAGTA